MSSFIVLRSTGENWFLPSAVLIVSFASFNKPSADVILSTSPSDLAVFASKRFPNTKASLCVTPGGTLALQNIVRRGDTLSRVTTQ